MKNISKIFCYLLIGVCLCLCMCVFVCSYVSLCICMYVFGLPVCFCLVRVCALYACESQINPSIADHLSFLRSISINHQSSLQITWRSPISKSSWPVTWDCPGSLNFHHQNHRTGRNAELLKHGFGNKTQTTILLTEPHSYLPSFYYF